MFPRSLLTTLALALSLSSAVLALAGPDAPTRLNPKHRMVKRAANPDRRRGHAHGHGNANHGRKGADRKSSAKASLAKATTKSTTTKSATTKSKTTTSTAKAYATSAAVQINAAYAEATTTTTKTTTTTSSKASTKTSSASSSTYSGIATWFTQDGTTGACGTKVSDSSLVVALDVDLYGDEDSVSQYCGKTLTIVNTANGKSVTATVNDACPGCSSKYSLDLSVGAFDSIGAASTGELDITWSFD